MHKEIALAIEPGLGDHFIHNGFVHHVSQFYDKIYLPVYDIAVHPNWATVCELYQDNPSIVPVRIDRFVRHWEPNNSWTNLFSSWNIPVLQPQLDHVHSGTPWYKWFYHQFLFPWSMWKSAAQLPATSCRAERLFEQVVGNMQEYAVVHDLSTAGHSPLEKMTSDLPQIRIVPGLSDSLLDWTAVLERASEIHVVASSVFCYTSLLHTRVKGRKFYHECRPKQFRIDPVDFGDWTLIDYGMPQQ